MNEELNNENVQVAEPVQTNFEPLPEPPKKKKKGKGFLIFLIVVLIIGGLIFGGIKLFKYLTRIDDPFPDIDTLGVTETIDYTNYLEEDYKNGTISADTYAAQSALAIFEPDKVDEKYKSTIINYQEPSYIYEFVAEHSDEISYDVKAYIYSKYLLADVVWDTGEDEETSGIYSYKVEKVSDKLGNVNKLSKVKLSSKGHFLIYYTTDGLNAITDQKAEELAKHLEYTASNYKKLYGLDFKYTATNKSKKSSVFRMESESHAAKLLHDNNIDTKYLDTALPVYVINLANSNAPAYYNVSTTTALDELWHLFAANPDFWHPKEDGSKYTEEEKSALRSASTTYTLPYFVINSSLDNMADTKIISSHELFHHYQPYICGNGEYVPCEYSSGNEKHTAKKFTIETTANLAAVEGSGVNTLGTEVNGHAWQYSKYGVEDSIDDESFQGYLAYTFAYNYKKVVPNGQDKLFKSLTKENPLKYLYDNSNGKYKEAFLMTVEKNLTLDYDNNQLLPYENSWSVGYPPNHETIWNQKVETESIKYSSSHYYYVDPMNYGDETRFEITTGRKDLTLLFFVYENNKYKKVYEQDLTKDFIVKPKDFKDYEQIVIVISNTSASEEEGYTIVSGETSKDPTITPESLKLKKEKTKGGDRNQLGSKEHFSSMSCYQVEDSDMFKTVTQVKLDFDEEDKPEDMYLKGTIQMKNYDPNDPAFKIAKTTVKGLLFVMKQKYKQELKSVRVSTMDDNDKFSILFKVKKDYYDAIKNSFNTESESKYDIATSIENEGFTCEYRY